MDDPRAFSPDPGVMDERPLDLLGGERVRGGRGGGGGGLHIGVGTSGHDGVHPARDVEAGGDEVARTRDVGGVELAHPHRCGTFPNGDDGHIKQGPYLGFGCGFH